MLNAQLIAQIGLLMFQRLTNLISSDNLLDDRQDEERLEELLGNYMQEASISTDDMEWMMTQHGRAYESYLKALPDIFHRDVVNDDTLMSKLERSSSDFKDASKCFGFNAEDYNNAFLQYVEDIKGILDDRLSTVQPSLHNKSTRQAAKNIRDSLGFRVQIAFGDYPQWRPRIPVMVPSTFAAMAETFMRFPNAITEVQLLKLSSVPLMLRRLSHRSSVGFTPCLNISYLEEEEGHSHEIPRLGYLLKLDTNRRLIGQSSMRHCCQCMWVEALL